MGARSSAHGQGALTGLRVLDLSRVLAGPTCTQLLADMGADVIKVERVGSGDDTRSWGPPFVRDAEGEDTAETAYFWSCNRGKRSLTLDLSVPQGQSIVKRLAAISDVLVENYKVGALKRFGLDYTELSKRHESLIYCSITGFGQTGPHRMKPGYDTIIQAIGGLMSVTGRAAHEPGGGPLKAGLPLVDLMTGLYATTAILAALQFRNATGRGQHIDLSLLDVQIASLANVGMNYLVTGETPTALGNRLPTLYPSDVFPCRNGQLMLIVGNDAQFARFCAAAGLNHVAADGRFATSALRVRHANDLAPLITRALARQDLKYWLEVFSAAGIACGPVNNIGQVFADPHVDARAMRVSIPDKRGGAIPAIGNPIRFSESPVSYGRPPVLGEHTHDLLEELLGMSKTEISELSDQGVI